ncbi:uncharacterized protein LOC122856167 [Aphidius gifuensis]|uniref:uncharacterized protein LOC122856167 n=1 Tax=Aphidius gifuensis TaxID=684658 RepID=UPI001CDC32F3|nr:uncharacterized protein LOC122856167 [Aphidius gifuensis]
MTIITTNMLTPIQQFYSGQNVFITGGTGFLGKILIEKLLRSCPDISSIYILVRPKKGQDIIQRIENIFDDPVFERLKKEQSKFRHKIFGICGDCSKVGLGLSTSDRDLLASEVSIVFNVAATVRFDEKIEDAVAINIRGPKETLDLCRSMKQLRSVVHVSTAYSNCNRDDIDEKFYEAPISGDNIMKLISTLDSKKLSDITKILLDDFPNTYAYTKQIAEQIIQQYGKDLPVGIFRPAIVISTYKEPISGWIDNVYGPTGALVGAGAGLIRTLNIDKNCTAELVPVDYTVNALVASAWDIVNKKNEAADPPIYNYNSTWNNKITWGEYIDFAFEYGKKIPSIKSIWCYSMTPVKNKIIYYILRLLLHLLPGLLIDIGLIMTFKKPRILNAYKKIHKFSNVTAYFGTHMWKFSNTNTQLLWRNLSQEDKDIFYFSMNDFNWRDFVEKSVNGLRLYTFKDDPSTIPMAKKRMAKLLLLHKIIKWGTIGLVAWFFYTLINMSLTSATGLSIFKTDTIVIATSIYADHTINNDVDTDNENESNNNNENINNTQVIMGTPIQNFYAGQNVFITGGTGFLGKTLVEKLLRSCDISTIYLLVRPKKGLNIIDRLDDLFNDPIFDCLKKNSPKFRYKVVPIAGDVEKTDLGLSPKDRELLIQEVSIVFNSAATVRFDEKLRIATTINAGGTLETLKLVNEMTKLKAMVHVSTAYSNCHEDIIEERFYSHPIKYENLKVVTKSLTDEAIEDVLPRLLENWPNTYTFTKAVAEQVVRQMSNGKPIGIFRPGIIISAAEEPLPGWVDNYYGPTGGVTAASLGVLKTTQMDPNVKANLVPVDYTVNALIACAWDISTQTTRRNDDMLIYNYVSTTDAPVTWNNFFIDYCLESAREYPILQTKWYMTFSITKNRLAYNLSMIFLHLLPALLVDLIFLCTGQKPKLYKMLSKIFKYLDVVRVFTMKDWNWKANNVPLMWKRLDQEDQKIFKFSLTGFNWKEYSRNYMMGIKIYLFKEGLNTLEASKERQKRLRIVHEGL